MRTVHIMLGLVQLAQAAALLYVVVVALVQGDWSQVGSRCVLQMMLGALLLALLTGLVLLWS